MLKYLATAENIRKLISEKPIYNRGKVVEKAAGNFFSKFPDITLHESRAVLFETRDVEYSDFLIFVIRRGPTIRYSTSAE